MKIKGIKTESLEKVINAYYQANKEVIDVWQELMIAAQTDIELNLPTQEPSTDEESVPEIENSVSEKVNSIEDQLFEKAKESE